MTTEPYNHGSLFTGIGGFDLAAEWMGWTNQFNCEIKPNLRETLLHYWPNAKQYDSIQTTDFKPWRGEIDILSGGDPCQPSSIAGLGKGTEDDRYLWPEMFRAIREIQPFAVLNENVNGTIANGILDIKINDLESEGYACQPYCIPAEAVGALHKRERVWLIAINSDRKSKRRASPEFEGQGNQKKISQRNHLQYTGEPVSLWPADTDSDIERFQEQYYASESRIFEEGYERYFGLGSNPYGHIPTDVIKSGIIRMLDGLPEGMDYTKRNQRHEALGNAIVPQLAYLLFKAIASYDQRI